MVRPRPLVLMLAVLGCVCAAPDTPHDPGNARARIETLHFGRTLQHHKLMEENTIRSQNVAAVVDDRDTRLSILHSNRYGGDQRDPDLHPKRPGSVPWNSGDVSGSTKTPQPFQPPDYVTESDTKGAAPFTVWTPGEKGKTIREVQGGQNRNVQVNPALTHSPGTARSHQKDLKNLSPDSEKLEEDVHRRDMMGSSLRKVILGRSKRSAGGFWSVQVQRRDLMGNALRRFHKVTEETRNSGKRGDKGWRIGDINIHHYKTLDGWYKMGEYKSSSFKHLDVTSPKVTVTSHLRRLFLQKLRRISELNQKISVMVKTDAVPDVPSNVDNNNRNKVGMEGDESDQMRFFVGRKLLFKDSSQEDEHIEDEKQREVKSEESTTDARRDIVGNSLREDATDKHENVIENVLEDLAPRDIMGNIYRGRRSYKNIQDQPQVDRAYPIRASSSAGSQRRNMGGLRPDLDIRFGPKTGWTYSKVFLPHDNEPINVYNSEERGNNKGNAGYAVPFLQDQHNSPTKRLSQNRQGTLTRGVRSFDKIMLEIRKPRDVLGNIFRNVMIEMMSISKRDEPVFDMSITVGISEDSSDNRDPEEVIQEERPDSAELPYEDAMTSPWYTKAHQSGRKRLIEPVTNQNTDGPMARQYVAAKAAPFD
ncbi:Hypp5291 [Branchiostoma lanceolatum]|uniref:Hypp5291 protein n=1 Tax=Branchiostoma lanceolatum TaxID=7740 RepID=A0A8K0F1R1_BRALA|nr:Hypp5291 [Branchiostoma lanceolatum]